MQTLQANILSKYQLTSDFNDLDIDVFLYESAHNSNNYTIVIHGLYGFYDELDFNSKDYFLREKIQKELNFNVVYYNSSRLFKFANTLEYRERIKSFIGKQFSHEVSDLEKVINSILKINNSAKISLIGNSLGGTIMIPIIGSLKYKPNIINAIFCGSGCGTNGSTKPILGSHPGEEYMLSCIEKYSGNLLLMQGELDTKVPIESGVKIFKHCKSKVKERIILKNMDHSFSKYLGETDIEAKKHFTNQIVIFLQNNH